MTTSLSIETILLAIFWGVRGRLARGGGDRSRNWPAPARQQLGQAQAQRLAGRQEPLAAQAALVPVGARHHHRHRLGHRADGLRRRLDAGRARRHQAPGRDQHHRPQRQAARRFGSPQRRSFVTTYGLVKRDLDRFETIGDPIVRTGADARLPKRRLGTSTAWSTAGSSAPPPEYADVNKLELAGGRFLTAVDERGPDELLRARLGGGRQALPVRGPARQGRADPLASTSP